MICNSHNYMVSMFLNKTNLSVKGDYTRNYVSPFFSFQEV